MNAASIPLFPVQPHDVHAGLTGRDLLRQWCKYWGTIVASTVTVGAIMVAAGLMQPAPYVSTAKVWVKTEQQGSTTFLSGVAAYREGQAPDPANRKIETEMQLLQSRSNIEAVVRKLGLTKNDFPGTPLDTVMPHLSAPKPRSPQQQLNDTIAAFLKALSVEAARSKTADTSSNLLEIKLQSVRPEVAAQALNLLVEQYRQYGARQTRDQGQASYALISGKMQQAQTDLNSLDKEILKLTVAQGKQLDISTPVPGVTDSPRIETDSGLRMDTMLASGRAGGASAVGLIKSQTVTLQSRLEELQQLYTDDAEIVKNTKRQLAQTQGRLNRSVTASAELDAQLRQLERSRTLALDRFTELRRKLDQIELYLSSSPDELATRVLTEPAEAADSPESKKRLVLIALGPVAGIALGLLLAGLRAYFDHRLQSTQDVSRYLGLDTLGIVPDLGKEAA